MTNKRTDASNYLMAHDFLDMKSRPTSRKEQRKLSRTLKKQKHHTLAHRPAQDSDTKSAHEAKRQKRPVKSYGISNDLSQLGAFEANNPQLYRLLEQDGLVPRSSSGKRAHEDIVEDNDVRLSKYYAKKLKMKNANKITSALKADGLDFLLEPIVEKENASKMVETGDSASDVSDASENETESNEATESSEEDYTEEESGNENSRADTDSDADLSEQSETGVLDFDDISADACNQQSMHLGQAKEQSVPQKYVPPHLRKISMIEDEIYLRLKKQVQGQLNRMSETNIESIFIVLEELYRNCPRASVTRVLTDIVISAVDNSALQLEDFIVTNACIIALLFNIVGHDVGAYFVQELVGLFDRSIYTCRKSQDEESKSCTNLAVLLAHLFNYRVISTDLIFDIMNECAKSLKEVDVEIILKFVRLCGSKLRADSPESLKEFIMCLQNTTAESTDERSIRFKFMLEQIYNLKNNRINKAPDTELLDRLRKFVRGMINKRNLPGVEPLRCSLEDIRSVDVKGKWWVVGAAWTGRQYGADLDPIVASRNTDTNSAVDQIARKMNINTDVRRAIFGILMSSEDYVDAFEKLCKLGLKDKQEREIVRMILYCCCQERAFNPYYAVIAERLCRHSHNHKITLQFGLWDFIKELGVSKVPVRRIAHMARMFGFLITKHALSLSVLKTIDFSASLVAPGDIGDYPDPSPTGVFLQMVLTELLLLRDEENVKSVFGRISQISDFQNLRRGLSLFMTQWIKRRLALQPKAEIWSILRKYRPSITDTQIKELVKMRTAVAKNCLSCLVDPLQI